MLLVFNNDTLYSINLPVISLAVNIVARGIYGKLLIESAKMPQYPLKGEQQNWVKYALTFDLLLQPVKSNPYNLSR